jgi:hypothetical protein
MTHSRFSAAEEKLHSITADEIANLLCHTLKFRILQHRYLLLTPRTKLHF